MLGAMTAGYICFPQYSYCCISEIVLCSSLNRKLGGDGDGEGGVDVGLEEMGAAARLMRVLNECRCSEKARRQGQSASR